MLPVLAVLFQIKAVAVLRVSKFLQQKKKKNVSAHRKSHEILLTIVKSISCDLWWADTFFFAAEI